MVFRQFSQLFLALFFFGLASVGCSASKPPVPMNVPLDGERIAYLVEERPSPPYYEGFVQIVRANGTGAARLTAQPIDTHFAPQWSPDGKQLAFNTLTPGSCPTVDILVIHADGSGQKKIATGVNPIWSPDGTRIAFADNDCDIIHPGVYVTNADGSETHRLGDGGGEIHWSPDGTRLFFLDYSSGPPPLGYVIKTDGIGKTPFTVGAGWALRSANWSPDGKKIYTYETISYPAQYRASVTDLATGIRSDFPIPGLPIWSPDGTRFVAQTENGIVLANADGTGAHTISQGFDPSWSPDGTRIAYTNSNILDQAHIYVVDVNGGEPKDIAKGYYPVWAPQ